jgi:hypothetical protein
MTSIVITVEYAAPPDMAYCSNPNPQAAATASTIERPCWAARWVDSAGRAVATHTADRPHDADDAQRRRHHTTEHSEDDGDDDAERCHGGDDAHRPDRQCPIEQQHGRRPGQARPDCPRHVSGGVGE